MEVHHHSSHSNHKKSFGEYLTEFCMIFLAVTAGFFAETYREYLADHKKEKEYIVSLIADLKQDTLLISKTTKAIICNTRGEDSLIQLLNNYKKNDSINKKAYYYYFSYTISVPQVIFTDRTISQLLSSGNMRLIEHNISDSIIAYDFISKGIKIQGTYYNQLFKNTFDQSVSVFDFTYASRSLNDDYSLVNKVQDTSRKYKLITDDSTLLKKYNSTLTMYQLISDAYVFNLREGKVQASKLIHFLSKKYEL